MSTWLPLCLTLSILGVVGAVLVGRRRGPVAATRTLAWALLPMALYLTGLLTLIGRIGSAIARFAGALVFSPAVWLGVALLGLSMTLFVVTGVVRSRSAGRSPSAGGRRPKAAGAAAAKPTASAGARRKAVTTRDISDPLAGFEDIEELLKRRGI